MFILLCACSSPLNKEAKEQMEKTLKEFSKNRDIQISNTKTVFEIDSLVIFNCVVREVLENGLDVPIKEEYVYLLGNDGKRREYHTGLEINGVQDVDLSVFSIARKRAEEFGQNYEQDSAKYIILAAEEVTSMFGKIIDN